MAASEGELRLNCTSFSKRAQSGTVCDMLATEGTVIHLSLLFNPDFVVLLVFHCGEVLERIPLTPSIQSVVITASQSSLQVTTQTGVEYRVEFQQDSDPTVLLDKICDLRMPGCKLQCPQSWRDSYLRDCIRHRITEINNKTQPQSEGLPTEPISEPTPDIKRKLMEDVTRIWKEITRADKVHNSGDDF